MLADCIDIFKNVYDIEKSKGKDIITDDYIPTAGRYIIVDESFSENYKIVDIKLNKDGTVEDETIEELEFIKIADYHSRLISMNKSLDGKKIIHSNNYLSFFVKGESYKNGKLNDERIDAYYDLLLSPDSKYSTKKKSKEIFEINSQVLTEINSDLLEKCRTWIKNNYKKIEVVDEKQYVKIFFKQNKGMYIEEGKRYIIPNVYNDNDYNVNIDTDTVYGMPNNNIGLNSKKIYLKNKTRKNEVPFLVSQNDILLHKQFFDFLLNQVSKKIYTIYFDINNNTILGRSDNNIINLITKETFDEDFYGYEFNLKKGTEVEIIDFDIINFKNKLSKKITIKNYLGLMPEKIENYIVDDYGDVIIEKYSELENIINTTIFSKTLCTNYFNDISVKEPVLKRNITLHRKKLYDWLRRGNQLGVEKVINQMTKIAITNSLHNGWNFKGAEQLNIRFSLLKHFGGDDMADKILDVKNSLRKKINSNQTIKIENDMEYFFAVGQVVAYMNMQNKGAKKNNSIINTFANSKDNKILKDRLNVLYKKYNYIIDSKRFNNMFSMIMSYECEQSHLEDIIIAGFLHSNLIIEKADKSE